MGWVKLLLGTNGDAATFLQRSIVITPGSGRPYLLLAAAGSVWAVGEARKAQAKAMDMRPGSTVRNVALSTRNACKAVLGASNAIILTLVEFGLPPGTPR